MLFPRGFVMGLISHGTVITHTHEFSGWVGVCLLARDGLKAVSSVVVMEVQKDILTRKHRNTEKTKVIDSVRVNVKILLESNCTE